MFFTQNNVYVCVCNHWLKVANGFKATLEYPPQMLDATCKYRLRTRLQFGLLFWVLWGH